MTQSPPNRDPQLPIEGLTARIEALERELASAREESLHLREIMAHVGVGLAVLRDGRFTLTNEKLTALTGHGRSALDTFALDAFLHPEDRKRVLDTLRQIQAGERPEASLRFRMRRESGESRVMQASLATMPWNGRPAVLACLQDVTSVVRFEDEAHRNRRLEVIGALAAGIAHDFNNILGTITGYTELARLEAPAESGQASNLGKVLRAARRAHALVDRILTYSQRAESVMQPLHLESLVRRADVLVRASMPASIDLRLELADRDTAVMADATQIEQVLLNLTTNARQAMRETGGELLIAVEPVTLSAPREYLPAGSYVRLRVADTGLGMDEQTRKRIFEPYFTTKGHGQGTGLGLAVTQGIVEAHGGRILAESALGEGSIFDVYLPRVPQGSAMLETPVDMKIYPGTERILLVDDEEPLVELGEQLLTQFGYRVRGYTSAEEALARFRDDPAAFDLVVTDQNMPHLSGAQLATRLLGLRPDLPIILVTGYSEQYSQTRARDLGFRGYLRKPVELSELTRAIRVSLGDDLH